MELADLYRLALDDRYKAGSRNHPRQRKARLTQQCAKLGFGPLLSARSRNEHLQVCESREVGLVGRFQDELNQQHRAVRPHRAAAVSQDRDRVMVVPIVNDVFRDIRVRAFGNGLKEIDGHGLTALLIES
jgi:hypothetical protein